MPINCQRITIKVPVIDFCALGENSLMAEEGKPKSENLTVKAIGAVFATVLAPILVAVGLKFSDKFDKIFDRFLDPAKATDAKTDGAKTDSSGTDTAPSDSANTGSGQTDDRTTDVADFALSFDGKSYVTLPKQLTYDGNTPLTIEARIVPATLENTTVVCDAEKGGVTLEVRKDGVLFSLFVGGQYVHARSTEFLATGKPINVAGVTDRKQLVLFINGKKVASAPADLDQFTPSTLPFLIGANPGAKGKVTSPFIGRIDEVRISRVARYMNDYTPRPRLEADKDTLALFHCDQGSGGALLDSSNHKYHGTITGAKWVYADGSRINPPAAKPRK